jgi:mannose-1-phosphate guanylyltransferase
MKIRPVILCGGAGTRLFPESKKNLPKQFIDWGGWTLFGKTLERIKSPIFDYPIITSNVSYLSLIKKFLKKHKVKKYKIILEPVKKNTAPAILSAALLKEIPNTQPMIYFPSDNLLTNENTFKKFLYLYKKYLTSDNIFIFGIKPKSPSSEYGYFLTKKIKKNLNKVTRFIEKPNKSKVKIIIKNKGYMNSGMFFARKESLLKNFKKHQSHMYKNCLNAVKK